jgi:subtilisin family serine protease
MHVTGIAAGNGRSGGPTGIAPEADLVFVHLTTLDQGDDKVELADSATLLEAIDFVRRVAGARPWVVNLSMGQTGDPHDGTTLVEQGLDAALTEAPGRAIVQSTGNYWDARLHSSGRLRPGEGRKISWQTAGRGGNELEIWYPGRDAIPVALYAPDGRLAGRTSPGERTVLAVGGRQCGTMFHRLHEPNNLDNHILASLDGEIAAGPWTLVLTGRNIVDGTYHVWIQRDDVAQDAQSSFGRGDANPYFTTGSICNGARTIAVGAYNGHSPRRTIAHFSSAGPTRDGRLKPDLLAPGVAVLSARSAPDDDSAGRGLLVRMSGTSMAAPHVTGTVALMFEAAPQPLRIENTINLLLTSTQRPAPGERQNIRYGSGYLDIDGAVRAARSFELFVAETQWSPRTKNEAAQPSLPQSVTDTREVTGIALGTRLPSEGNGSHNGPSGPLALADYLIGLGGVYARSPAACLARVLFDSVGSPVVDPLAAHGLLDPAIVFDGFTTARLAALRRYLDRVLAVVAYPHQSLLQPPSPAIFWCGGRWGSPGSVIWPLSQTTKPIRRKPLGLEDCEQRATARAGFYVRVIEAGALPHRLAHRFARRVAGPDGRLPAETLLLRPRVSPRRQATMRTRAESLPEAPSSHIAPSPDIDVNRAVQLNPQYAVQLGWGTQRDQINALLGLDSSASDQDFAEAVANWQGQHGLSVDGIIGPDTWSAMQPLLGIPPAPTPPPAPVPPLPPTPIPPSPPPGPWDPTEVGDFGKFYAMYLDKYYPNDNPTQHNSYTQLRDFWTLQSWVNAFGGKDDGWDPTAGFAANENRIVRLYDYYRDLFNSNPSAFLWAGLGRMAGGAVLGGLRFLVKGFIKLAPDPSFLTNTMALIGKQIFLDLAWQHELFRNNAQQAITAAQSHDGRFPAKVSYATD